MSLNYCKFAIGINLYILCLSYLFSVRYTILNSHFRSLIRIHNIRVNGKCEANIIWEKTPNKRNLQKKLNSYTYFYGKVANRWYQLITINAVRNEQVLTLTEYVVCIALYAFVLWLGMSYVVCGMLYEYAVWTATALHNAHTALHMWIYSVLLLCFRISRMRRALRMALTLKLFRECQAAAAADSQSKFYSSKENSVFLIVA